MLPGQGPRCDFSARTTGAQGLPHHRGLACFSALSESNQLASSRLAWLQTAPVKDGRRFASTRQSCDFRCSFKSIAHRGGSRVTLVLLCLIPRASTFATSRQLLAKLH